ncbi:MAG: ThiF family adenylyltransferase [Methylophilus sp.]|nr:ThiF family adenylyltransferase [Methylophilus sp.]
MNYGMKMLDVHRCQMQTLLKDTSREQACFLLCGLAYGNDETTILVREVIELARSDLTVHSYDRLQVSPTAMLSIARRAQELQASVCMVHTHPMSNGEVEFSEADDIGNQKTFEFFGRMIPSLPHTCLVWDGPLQTFSGRVYFSANDWKPISNLEVVNGENRKVFGNCLKKPCNISETYNRQAILLGKEGQKILSDLKVGIVGCGGIGSLASALLVHSGVQKFNLYDFDKVRMSNLPRIIGATPNDVGTSKVKILERYIKALNAEAEVAFFEEAIEAPHLLKQIIDLDVLICGTDDTTSRAFLNQICHQYYTPVLDMGVQFKVDNDGQLVSEIGRANLMLPGTVCMCCCGYINPIKLQQEGLTEAQHQQQVEDGYLSGSDIKEPSMMVFNMQVASLGVQRLIEWVTGLNSINPNQYESFRFLGINSEQGTRKVNKRSVNSCPFCGEKSIYLGVGDNQELMVKPRRFITS